MKRILTLVLLMGVVLVGQAQKKELKAAEKALESNQYAAALNSLSAAKPMLENAKDRYKAQYYFLLGKSYYANGTKPENLDKVQEAFNKLFEIEKKSGDKYSKEANGILINAKMQLYQDANKEFSSAYDTAQMNPDEGKKMYNESAEKYFKVYNLSQKVDTVALYQAARAYHFGGKYDKSLEYANELINLGYTGKGTQYYGTSVANNSTMYFNSKKDLDLQVKLGIIKDPQVKVFESQVADIYALIARNYTELKDYDKALKAIAKARELKPKDYSLVIDEANIYYFKGDKTKFKEKLEEAVQINPNNPVLHFNIGVMKMEQKDTEGAIKSYQKAIELDPKYVDAYNNLGAVILEEAKPIVDQMNNTNDFDKYDELQKQQLAIYRKALPYYEKAYELDNTRLSVVQTLLGIYENLEMDAKTKEMREVYNKLKNQ
jgi:tetratricopeptide (TPR) repeat protein